MAIFALGWVVYLAISGCIVYLKSDYFNFDKSLNLCCSRKTFGTIWWILEDWTIWWILEDWNGKA
jgi:hypothetical protein